MANREIRRVRKSSGTQKRNRTRTTNSQRTQKTRQRPSQTGRVNAARQVQRTAPKKKKRHRRGPWGTIFGLTSLICIILFTMEIFDLNVFPLYYVIPVVLILIALTILLFRLYNFTSRRKITRLFAGVILAAFTIVFGFGAYYVHRTADMFDMITSLTDQVTHTESVITMVGSPITDVQQLKGKKVGTIYSIDAEATQYCMDDLANQGVTFNQQDYEYLVTMLDDLYAGNLDAILLNEKYRGIIHSEYEDPYFGFNQQTNVIYKSQWFTPKENVIENTDKVSSVITKPFTILVSGNDSYGDLEETARSDVNMLVTINPTTHTVLMTSMPRDTYTTIACAADDGYCPNGQYDKLTHSGLYGIETTDKTIEEMMGITINYYVRVNFSSLVNIVDSVGGIDIEVAPGMAVEHFGADASLEGVTEGWNHLDGERALAYSREREAYMDGDNQRVRNQQQVLRALIDKCISPSMLLNFGKFVDALSGAFETNMSADEIKALLRYQVSFNPEWIIEGYAMAGNSDLLYCASLGTEASVIVVDDAYLQEGRAKIQAVLDGHSSTEVGSNDTTEPVGTWDQTEEPVYEEPDYSYSDQTSEDDTDSGYYFSGDDYSDEEDEY